jgi:hypothetical protein
MLSATPDRKHGHLDITLRRGCVPWLRSHEGTFEDGVQPILVSMSTLRNAFMSRCRHTLSLCRICQCPGTFLSCLSWRSEIKHALAFGPEDLSVLLSILRQHEPAEGGYLKRSHDMTIAIGAAYEAEIHCGAGGELSDAFDWLEPKA